MKDMEFWFQKRKKLKLGWFTTANGEGSREMFNHVVKAIDDGDLDAEISFVFVNKDFGESLFTDDFMRFVTAKGIPLVQHSSKKHRKANNDSRWRYDAAIWRKVLKFKADLFVMGGYMLYAPMLCQFTHTINLHPALSGTHIGTWQESLVSAIRSGDVEFGAMVHVATKQIDEGPPLATARFTQFGIPDVSDLTDDQVKELDIFADIRKDIMSVERPLMERTIQAISKADKNITRALDKLTSRPLDLHIGELICLCHEEWDEEAYNTPCSDPDCSCTYKSSCECDCDHCVPYSCDKCGYCNGFRGK